MTKDTSVKSESNRPPSKSAWKTLVTATTTFVLGFLLALFLARYASPMEAYGERLRAQQGLEQEGYDAYQGRRYASAAAHFQGASLLGTYSLDEWDFWRPIRGSVYRAIGGLDDIHSQQRFNDPMIAYMLRLAGDDAAAKPYYESVEREKHKTQGELDTFAKTYMDQVSATDRADLKRLLRDNH
jgi:hypothetical protein